MIMIMICMVMIMMMLMVKKPTFVPSTLRRVVAASRRVEWLKLFIIWMIIMIIIMIIMIIMTLMIVMTIMVIMVDRMMMMRIATGSIVEEEGQTGRGDK